MKGSPACLYAAAVLSKVILPQASRKTYSLMVAVPWAFPDDPNTEHSEKTLPAWAVIFALWWQSSCNMNSFYPEMALSLPPRVYKESWHIFETAVIEQCFSPDVTIHRHGTDEIFCPWFQDNIEVATKNGHGWTVVICSIELENSHIGHIIFLESSLKYQIPLNCSNQLYHFSFELNWKWVIYFTW